MQAPKKGTSRNSKTALPSPSSVTRKPLILTILLLRDSTTGAFSHAF